MDNNLTVEILLSGGKVALIDAEDAERVNQFEWKVRRSRSTYYGYRPIYANGKQSAVQLHRFILNAPDGVEVDHKNRNGLDCRKANLRLVTPSLNRQNSPPRNSTGLKGVYRDKRSGKYRASITIQYKDFYLGAFETALEAGMAYDKKAKELYGPDAYANFPLNQEAK